MTMNYSKIGRPPGRLYPRRLMVFLDDERALALEELARRERMSKAAIMRSLIDAAIRECERSRKRSQAA
jgi:hypothetical protein